jgi:hypothetical protein
MRTLFGADTSPAAPEYLREHLDPGANDEIIVCPDADIVPCLAGVDAPHACGAARFAEGAESCALRRPRGSTGAGLDVFWQEPSPTDDPILTLPNVIATPHVGGVTESSFGMIAEVIAENIERLRRGESPLHRVV